ncbi:hypothetical protein ACUODJ_04110, partial [Escherichia sp. HC-CC]
SKAEWQKRSLRGRFLKIVFAFITLYICLTTYSGGDDESMDGDINKYLVLAIICVGGLSGLVASQSTGRNFPPATANKTVGR